MAGLVSRSAAVAASNAPAGDRAAIAFYERSEADMAGYQEITFRGVGTSYGPATHVGPAPFAVGSTPSGFKPASDTVKVIQRGGIVVEEVDTFSAPGQPTLTVWKQGTHKWVEQLQRPGACVYTVAAAGAADFATIGQPFVEPEDSTFALLMRIGGANIVRSTYPDEGATAHETDIINASSGLWISSSVSYHGGPFTGFATSMDMFHYDRTARVIAVPSAGHC